MHDTTDPLALCPGMTAGAVAQAVLLRQAAALAEGLSAVLLHDAEEGPHAARVALRRLRCAIWAFSPVLRRRVGRRWDRRCRDLFRQLGPLRDADVLAMARAGTPEGAVLAATAARLRTSARRSMCDGGALGVPAGIADLAQQGARRGSARDRPALDFARGRLDAAWQACRRHGDDLMEMPDADLHALRKVIKRMRYVAEFVQPVWPDPRADAWILILRRLQDSLGAVCDDLLAARSGLPPPALAARTRRHAAAAVWAEALDRPKFWQADQN